MNDEEWDGVNPPIIKIQKGAGMLWQAFCCPDMPPKDVVVLANRHHHPGTSKGWAWPTDDAYRQFCEANNEKWKIQPPMTVKEFKAGIPCKNREGYKHWLLYL